MLPPRAWPVGRLDAPKWKPILAQTLGHSRATASRHRIVPTCMQRMTPSEPAQRQPEPTQTAMSPHRLLSIVRAGGLEPARAGEQRGDQNPVASKEKDPHRDQQAVYSPAVAKAPPRTETRRTGWRAAEPRRSSLTTSCALGPDGEASGDSRPAERQRGHPGIHAAAGRRGRNRPPACCVGRTRAPCASSDYVEPPSPDAAARRFPAG